ncbi:MAG: hypothetical protein M1831_000430 [Alyxoria varia]|nr:MAG: hypothetical protein M1831_000430 [Alyxoria varia]
MTMAVDHRPQSHLGSMNHYDSMRYPQQPQFTNPWHPNPPTSNGASIYNSSYAPPPPPPAMEPPHSSKSSMSMGYSANPSASNLGSGELDCGRSSKRTLADISVADLVPTRSYGSTYSNGSSGASSSSSYTPSTTAHYSPDQPQQQTVGPYGYDVNMTHRDSFHPSPPSRASFSDEMASARGMVAMANSHDVTPRNIYGSSTSRAGSQDSYGFPPPHSQHSSISSASTYPYYSGSLSGSVDGSSVTDYSSASEDPMGPRTLPAPTQLINGYPPGPEAMMNQFNAKLSPSAQKKHKCKICDKRFTRPSSLQTHMYSHTGEKPFACDHHNCGRHFSVVSNLRRHKKVHKDEQERVSGDEE